MMNNTPIIESSINLAPKTWQQPTGISNNKSVSVNPKWKPLFSVLIILGLMGLGTAACGIAGIGAHHHLWTAGLFNQLGQTYSLILIFIGALGISVTIWKLAGLTKTSQRNEISIKEVPSKATNLTAKICITTQMQHAYIGRPTERQLMPDYLNELKLEDNSELPLDPQDFFIEFYLFNVSPQLKKTKLPPTIYLPAALFQNKKDGDTIRLKYKKQLIELTIEQENHELKFARGAFKDVFALQESFVREHGDIATPCFSIYDPNLVYGLGNNGAVFKLEKHKNNAETFYTLTEGVPADFRRQLKPHWVAADVYTLQEQTTLFFTIEFPSFKFQDFDILLNSRHLTFYARYENRQVSDIEYLPKKSAEAIWSCRWNQLVGFENLKLDDIKILMMKGRLSLQDGLLHFQIPLN